MDSTLDDLLADLNEPQRAAVAHGDGPLLILAGPGSGKTRVVTRRAAYLARTVTDTSHILAITFTNKAATEMRERIESLGCTDGMTVCTFHAFCAMLLRRFHESAGVPAGFTIFDRDDRRKVIKQAIEACELPAENWTPAALDQAIGQAKNAMMTATDFAATAHDWSHATIARIYQHYEAILRRMEGLDFDDLLLRAAIMLDGDADVCRRLDERFRYVLIDEYQDTNAAQYRIARAITQRHGNLCATGDPDQSIYGWRGANVENILRFEQDFPNARVIHLEQNYRSTRRILSCADSLIARNVNRKEKTLWTDGASGEPVCVVEVENGAAEADMIARDIVQRMKSGVGASDIAVFYRINSLSRVMEESLMRDGVPYQIARGVEFYGRKEIKDVLAYLRVLVNPADDVALLRIINTPPRGIGATTVRRLLEAARSSGRSVRDALRSDETLIGLGRSAAKVRQFEALLTSLTPVLEKPAPNALTEVLSRSGLQAMVRGEANADDVPAANLDELVSAAAAFASDRPDATVRDWLEHTALLGDVDTVDGDAGKVTLMTLHASKGLEFSVVYILGVEGGLVPFRRREADDVDEEEERRLLFVGMTRAKRRLWLSYARYRARRGVTERTVRSPFLDELPQDEVEWRCMAEVPNDPARPTGRLPEDIAEWTVGTAVRHKTHGLGQIMSMHRGSRRTHVDVQFVDGLRRSWVLEFARLERVDYDEIGDVFGVAGG